MSVTVTIRNNQAYCTARGMVDESERFPCDHCESKEHPSPDCHECNGKGYVSFPIFPFEMNISNGNFKTFWNSLALPLEGNDLCGIIDPVTVALALNSGDPALAVRQGGRSSGKSRQATLIEFGISTDQAERYHIRLAEIAKEALKRGEFITFS
jgi:hypothetical protein